MDGWISVWISLWWFWGLSTLTSMCTVAIKYVRRPSSNDRLTRCQRSWTRCKAGSRSTWTEESGQEVMYWNRWPWEPSVFSLAVQQCGALHTRYKLQHWPLCDTVCLYFAINHIKVFFIEILTLITICLPWHISSPLYLLTHISPPSCCPWQLKFIFESHWHCWS